MIYHNFDEFKESVISAGQKKRCGIVMATEQHILDAAEEAEAQGLIEPVFINHTDPEEAMEQAVAMVHSGEVDILMKGLLSTAQFMHAIVKRDNGLRTGSLIQMLTLRQLPNYHKLIGMTDTGICEAPSLEQKKELIQNAVNAMTDMGFDAPKVACLSAAETVNSRMISSTDAAELKKMWQDGQITGCTVEGPISIDLALSAESAAVKGYESPVAGDADLLLFPELASANIAGKLLAHVTGMPAGILILGAKIPVIVSSRAASVETKVLSIAMAAAKTT